MKRSKRQVQREVQEQTVQTVVANTKRRAKPSSNGTLPTAESLGIPRLKTGRLDPRKLGCLFNGDTKIRPTARFFPGNDARLTSQLVKVQEGKETLDSIRPEALVFLQEEGGIAGFAIIDGELVRTHKTAGKKTRANEELVEDEE
jgi:hypothetical protein